jgi:hypothetical protein
MNRRTFLQNLGIVCTGLAARTRSGQNIEASAGLVVIGGGVGGCATAACLAIDEKVSVQDLDYEILEGRLLADQQRLYMTKTENPFSDLHPQLLLP